MEREIAIKVNWGILPRIEGARLAMKSIADSESQRRLSFTLECGNKVPGSLPAKALHYLFN